MSAAERTPPVDGNDDLGLIPAEVYELWTFLDGSIMNPEVRHHLRRSWGHCARHSWAHAAVEIELRGGKPFSTAILYDDLVGRAAALFDASIAPWPLLRRRLRSHASCLTCDYVSTATSAGLDRQLTEDVSMRTDRANRRQRIAPLLRSSEDLWRGRACPVCADGTGLTCRMHLLDDEHGHVEREPVAGELRDLQQRLHRYMRSMTWHGPIATPVDSASWIEALGWFAGWGYPLRVLSAPSTEAIKPLHA